MTLLPRKIFNWSNFLNFSWCVFIKFLVEWSDKKKKCFFFLWVSFFLLYLCRVILVLFFAKLFFCFTYCSLYSLYKCKSMYKVRVLYYVNCKMYEKMDYLENYSFALERFGFYVRCAIELGVQIRCVNLIKGKKSIKMFQNH